MDTDFHPERTAMARTAPSLPAQLLVDEIGPRLRPSLVLDYGAGRGSDAAYLRRERYDVDVYDPYWAPEIPTRAARGYDLVTNFYVLNVLPSPEDREHVLRAAASYVRRGGHLLVAARSASEIATEARKGDWEPYGDGYRTGSGTFQHGLTSSELVALGQRVGLEVADPTLKLNPRTVIALFRLRS